MRSISADQAKLITAAVNEGKTVYPATSGFEIVSSTILNEYKFFDFELKYQEKFPPEVSLRPTIKIEFTFAKLHVPALNIPILTLIYRDLDMFHTPLNFSCVALEQTTAEKILSFLRRWDPTARNNDSRLVRHIHDVAILMEAQIDRDGLRISFQKAVEEDRTRFANSQPEFVNNPKKFLEGALSRLQVDESLNNFYKRFVLELVAGPAKSCGESLAIFTKVAGALISVLK